MTEKTIFTNINYRNGANTHFPFDIVSDCFANGASLFFATEASEKMIGLEEHFIPFCKNNNLSYTFSKSDDYNGNQVLVVSKGAFEILNVSIPEATQGFNDGNYSVRASTIMKPQMIAISKNGTNHIIARIPSYSDSLGSLRSGYNAAAMSAQLLSDAIESLEKDNNPTILYVDVNGGRTRGSTNAPYNRNDYILPDYDPKTNRFLKSNHELANINHNLNTFSDLMAKQGFKLYSPSVSWVDSFGNGFCNDCVFYKNIETIPHVDYSWEHVRSSNGYYDFKGGVSYLSDLPLPDHALLILGYSEAA